jgi:adenylate kinase family enzyme
VLDKALTESGMALDYVVEIVLERQIAKERIMGRRLCANDKNHPNHIAFVVIVWIEIHQEDLLADWELAAQGKKPFPIQGLDQ